MSGPTALKLGIKKGPCSADFVYETYVKNVCNSPNETAAPDCTKADYDLCLGLVKSGTQPGTSNNYSMFNNSGTCSVTNPWQGFAACVANKPSVKCLSEHKDLGDSTRSLCSDSKSTVKKLGWCPPPLYKPPPGGSSHWNQETVSDSKCYLELPMEKAVALQDNHEAAVKAIWQEMGLGTPDPLFLSYHKFSDWFEYGSPSMRHSNHKPPCNQSKASLAARMPFVCCCACVCVVACPERTPPTAIPILRG